MTPVDFLVGSNFDVAFNALSNAIAALSDNVVLLNEYMQGAFFKHFFAYLFVAILFGVFLGFFMFAMFKILTRSK